MTSVIQTYPLKPGAWDLSALFEGINDPKIEQTWKHAHERVDAFVSKYRGQMSNSTLSAEVLLEAVQEYEELCVMISKPVSFAELNFSVNSIDPQYGSFLQKQREKGSEVRIKLLFFDLELQKLPKECASSLFQDPLLGNYKHYLDLLRIYIPHSLDEAEEVILEETANTGCRAWVRLFEELNSKKVFHLKRPGIDSVECSIEEVLNCLRDPSRSLRQAAADSLSAGIDDLKPVTLFIYNNLLQDKSVSDRLRKHPYPEHSRHLSNELDKETVDLVMELCKEKGGLVSQYYQAKKDVLNLSELTHIDRYAPLFHSKNKIPYGHAKEIILKAFSGCHPELGNRAKEFFDKNWIDAAPVKGKRAGAFCSYNSPDTHPVIMMSYLDDMSDVKTLAHELGHGVHASLSREQTYFNYHGTLPLAELASTFGEMLVFEKLLETASDQDKLALYAQKIEDVFATVYRQAAMFRFEQQCHERRRTHGELTEDQFGEIWQSEHQSMFGNSLKLGNQHRNWWIYIGHFFFCPFYVYAYSFGELLALSIYQKYKKEGRNLVDKYIEVLQKGGKHTPDELMSYLDIDLRSKEFWLNGFDTIQSLVDGFENLWMSYRDKQL